MSAVGKSRIAVAILGFLSLAAAGERWPAMAEIDGSAAEWGGAWHGTYVCYQGVTGLDLTIKALDAETVMAVFSFHAIPENPLLPSGEFTMTGRPGPNSRHLRLSASSWTARPAGYVAVDLDGNYDPGTGEYRGRVRGPGCSYFHLRRDTMT
jgi:hypothetical protein